MYVITVEVSMEYNSAQFMNTLLSPIIIAPYHYITISYLAHVEYTPPAQQQTVWNFSDKMMYLEVERSKKKQV